MVSVGHLYGLPGTRPFPLCDFWFFLKINEAEPLLGKVLPYFD